MTYVIYSYIVIRFVTYVNNFFAKAGLPCRLNKTFTITPSCGIIYLPKKEVLHDEIQ